MTIEDSDREKEWLRLDITGPLYECLSVVTYFSGYGCSIICLLLYIVKIFSRC